MGNFIITRILTNVFKDVSRALLYMKPDEKSNCPVIQTQQKLPLQYPRWQLRHKQTPAQFP
jgi:hypothetical protein